MLKQTTIYERHNLSSDMSGHIAMPPKGWGLRLYGAANGSMLKVIDGLLGDTTGARLEIATYTISGKHIEYLRASLASGRFESVTLILDRNSIFRKKKDQPALNALAREFAARFTLCLASNHANVTLLKAGEKRIVIEGSANWTDSKMYEQISVVDNSGLYTEVQGFINYMIVNG